MKAESNTRGQGSHMLVLSFFAFISLSAFHVRAQSDSSTIDRKKLRTLAVVSAAGYTAGILTLNHVWYKDTGRQPFAFFNDNAEWKHMDKAGHFFASYHLSALPAHTLRRYGVPEKKADLLGALSGFMLTVPIEILDGYSDGYGASWGDVLADAAGPAFYLGQKLTWGEIRIHPKLSFHRTVYAPMRPALLGDNLLSEIVKDYNGQTQWWSFDVDKFTRFPKWLNVAIGYGAEEMIFARDSQNKAGGLNPHRQYYLALDFDLTAIRSRSGFVRTLLYVVNLVRLPAPALQFSRRGTKFYPFYF